MPIKSLNIHLSIALFIVKLDAGNTRTNEKFCEMRIDTKCFFYGIILVI